MDKLSLSDIKELVQGHRANKVKDTGFKFSHSDDSQYGPNHKSLLCFFASLFLLKYSYNNIICYRCTV